MSVALSRRLNFAFLVLLFALQIYALYPGRFDADANFMYLQSADLAGVTDHHSVLMTAFMALGRRIAAGPAPLFLLITTTWIVGLWLVSDTVIQSGRRFAGLLISLFCALPLISFIFVEANKDTAQAALGLVLVGALARTYLLDRPPGPLAIVGLTVLSVMFLDLRHNAAIALTPLVAIFLWRVSPWVGRSWLRAGAATLGVMGLLLTASHVVKYGVFDAGRSYGVRQLVMFDLAGVTRYSGQDGAFGLLGPKFRERALECYDPKFHDPFEWGECKEYAPMLADHASRPEGRAAMAKTWAKAVITHPAAYLRHRFAYYNQLIRANCQFCSDYMTLGLTWERPWRLAEKERISEAGRLYEKAAVSMYLSQLGRGLLWLIAIGAGTIMLLIQARRRRRLTPQAALALGLAASALLYALALLVIGVAFPLRYLHWTMMIGGIALILAAPSVHASRRERNA